MRPTQLLVTVLLCSGALAAADSAHPLAAAALQQAASQTQDWVAAHPDEIAAAKQQAAAKAQDWAATHPEQVAQVKAAATAAQQLADLNGDGTVSEAERQIAAAKAAKTAQQQAQAWAAAHPDEVAAATAKAKDAKTKADTARGALDSDGSGAVTQDEWADSSEVRRAATRDKAAGRSGGRSGRGR